MLDGEAEEIFCPGMQVLTAGEGHIAWGCVSAVRSRGGHLQGCLGLLPALPVTVTAEGHQLSINLHMTSQLDL